MTELTWRQSSFSGSQANCVEVAARGRVLVRDTKNESGAVLRFTPADTYEGSGWLHATGPGELA